MKERIRINNGGGDLEFEISPHIDKTIRNHNVGNSDYSKHKIQPWDIWIEYKLNPFDADIVKRILRKKSEPGMNEQESRKMDYQKIIHICQERIRQIDEGIEL